MCDHGWGSYEVLGQASLEYGAELPVPTALVAPNIPVKGGRVLICSGYGLLT